MNTRSFRKNKIFIYTFYPEFILFFLTVPLLSQVHVSLTTTSETPEILAPGVISTMYNERDFTLNNEKDLFCFSFAGFDNKKRSIVISQKGKDTWSDPEIVIFSGIYDDLEPFFAPGSQQLFFASNRPLPGETSAGDYNIWYSVYNNYAWSEPVALDTFINQEGDEFYPSLSANGNLYFTATRKDGMGKEDIFVAEQDGTNYKIPVALPEEINSATYEFNAFISPDEQILIFSSYGRGDDLGGGDLYYSKKDENGNWKKAEHLSPPVNSHYLDYCPFYDATSQTFYFTSNRKNSDSADYKSLEAAKKQQTAILNGFGNVFKVNAKVLFK